MQKKLNEIIDQLERFIIGINLKDPLYMLLSRDFLYELQNPKHKFIWLCMQKLDDENSSINICSVSDKLEEIEKLDYIGGRRYINDLVMNLPKGFGKDDVITILYLLKAVDEAELMLFNDRYTLSK